MSIEIKNELSALVQSRLFIFQAMQKDRIAAVGCHFLQVFGMKTWYALILVLTNFSPVCTLRPKSCSFKGGMSFCCFAFYSRKTKRMLQYQSNKMQHNYTTKICSYGQCSTVWRNYSTVQKRSEVPEVPAGVVTCSHTSVQQPVTV